LNRAVKVFICENPTPNEIGSSIQIEIAVNVYSATAEQTLFYFAHSWRIASKLDLTWSTSMPAAPPQKNRLREQNCTAFSVAVDRQKADSQLTDSQSAG